MALYRLSYNKRHPGWNLTEFLPGVPCPDCDGTGRDCKACQGAGLKRAGHLRMEEICMEDVDVSTYLWDSPGMVSDDEYGDVRGYLWIRTEV